MSAANHVLLVDDESKIVDALQRLLRPLRETWSVVTATSANAALELLDRETFEVVVSDMRMPEMDGAALLAVVKERFPGTTRVILSGQTENSAAIRALPVAHQFLRKPCPSSRLIDLLRRRTEFPLGDAALRERIGAIDSLPCDPESASALAMLVNGGKIRLAELTALVKTEPVLILKLLQLTSTSFFGMSRQSDEVAAAVSVAGEELLHTLAASARESSASKIASKRFDLRAFCNHAIEIAGAAQSVSCGGPSAATCFVAGMLHEIGKLVMATHAPEQFDAVSERVSSDRISFELAEIAEGVESHARIGAALLDLWGLPYSVVGAVARQNQSSDDVEHEVSTALDLAHRLQARSAA
jgi:HD-like signal output (HDOD) protein/CheY-like chemotaxis protein